MHSGPVSKVGTNLRKRDRGRCGQGGLGVGGRVRAGADRAGGGQAVHVSQETEGQGKGSGFYHKPDKHRLKSGRCCSLVTVKDNSMWSMEKPREERSRHVNTM